VTVDHLAARVGDEKRKQVVDHRANRVVGDDTPVPIQTGLGQPSRWDEQRRDEAPGDEGTDVRYHHPREEATKFLYSLKHCSFTP